MTGRRDAEVRPSRVAEEEQRGGGGAERRCMDEKSVEDQRVAWRRLQ